MKRGFAVVGALIGLVLWGCNDIPLPAEANGVDASGRDGGSGDRTVTRADLGACKAATSRFCDTGLLGRCRMGTQLCGATGSWEACIADKLQAPVERCDNQEDDDCDGLKPAEDPDCTGGADGGMGDAVVRDTGVRDTGVRDTGVRDAGGRDTGGRDTGGRDAGVRDTAAPDSGGGGCTPGTRVACATGLSLHCAAGTRGCGAGGQLEGPCVPVELGRRPEDCHNNQDDDCDGLADANDSDCGRPCTLPWSGSIASGETITAYQQNEAFSPNQCSALAEERRCTDGVLSGSYIERVCAQRYRGCMVPNYGQLLAHGSTLNTWVASAVACGQVCSAANISCNDGVISGPSSYIASCEVLPCAPPGFSCQSYPQDNYQRCERSLLSYRTAFGQGLTLEKYVMYGNQQLWLRFISFGTKNTDQQAYSDAVCATAVNYPMGSTVSYGPQSQDPCVDAGANACEITVPSCKPGIVGQCVTNTNCSAFGSPVGGAGYYRNLQIGWTSASVVYDSAAAPF